MSEALPAVLAAVPQPSKRTYTSGMRQLVTSLGDRELDSVGIVELRALRDSIEQHTGAHIVARAVERGRRLRSYDPQSFGQGAASNFVMAVRFFFRFAVDVGWLSSSPAETLKSPRRHPGLRRPLLPEELAEIWTVATTTGHDPELDELILTFLRHTAARREGSLNLTVGHVQPSNDRVLLSEKYGHTRVLPLRRDVGERLLTFAASRGSAAPADPIFRYRSGRPLTRRRFNSLFDRIDRHTDFTEELDISAHWIRHTTLADIAAVSDVRVAETYAGHSLNGLGVIGRYTAVTFDDLQDAYQAVFP
ncbi:tyrosine-type recombinase/integrase [Knoellia sp. CPCC 206435]|uniref:tyrosine-type recombinase/integrase n=1 Tax=Knoellia terrae TaxID=3404797 RepID=UPI003B42F42E